MLISIIIDIFFTCHVRMLGMIILLPAIKQLTLINPLWKHLSNLNKMAHTVPLSDQGKYGDGFYRMIIW